NHLDIGKTVFSQQELRKFTEEADILKAAKFYEYWTRKEAFIKATGHGLSMPIDLKHISVITDTVQFDRKAQGTTLTDSPQWIIYSFTPQANYKAAIVFRKRPMEIIYRTWGD
ncbi:MAG: 4'-phosphopantetheinyl transferase superfamily protein, partial [Flavobacteriaceae bacterium]